MKKRLIAMMICITMIAGLSGCASKRREEEEDRTPISAQEEGETPGEEDSDIDESLIPILPELSAPEPDAEELAEEDGMLTIVFFGDSQFENGSADHTDIPYLVHNYTGSRILNMGAGGTCAALTRNDSDDPDNWDNLSFYGMTLMLKGNASRDVLEGKHQLTVMEAINPEEVDYYVISYGLNDFLNGIRPHIGGEENIPRNYYAALRMGIDNLEKISPQAQYILCTPCYTQFFNQAGAYLGDSHTHDYGIGNFDEYGEQVRHIAEGSYLCLDAAFDTMMNLNSTNAAAYLSDGVHLTKEGREAYALALSYIIARDQGWTNREMERIDIDHLDWAAEFLEDIPR